MFGNSKVKKIVSTAYFTVVSFLGTMILSVVLAILLTIRINRMELSIESLSPPWTRFWCFPVLGLLFWGIFGTVDTLVNKLVNKIAGIRILRKAIFGSEIKVTLFDC